MAWASLSTSKFIKLSHLDLDCATFTCVPHVSNLICSTASAPRITRKCQGSTSIPLHSLLKIKLLAVSPTYMFLIQLQILKSS